MWKSAFNGSRAFRTGFRRFNSTKSIRQAAPGRAENVIMLILVGFISSELMYIIRLRNEKERLQVEYKTQSRILDKLIERATNGEKVDVEKELMIETKEPDSLEEILKSLEETDNKWQTSQQIPKAAAPKPETVIETPTKAPGVSLAGSGASDGKKDASKFL